MGKIFSNRELIDDIICGSEVCRLALAVDDHPYLVPMSFGYNGDAIFVHTAQQGKKIDYFETNNRVCFEFERHVHPLPNPKSACNWSFSFESVIGYGTIHELTEDEDKAYALKQIVHHYAGTQPDFQDTSLKKVRVWKISIDSMTARSSRKDQP
ncbi:MAG: pyridoxamine 5'-phosphate oxidase family protein [Chloroflexota bacterium]